MSPGEIKLTVAGALALIAWLFGAKAAPPAARAGRVKSELEINADVYSADFGKPIGQGIDMSSDPSNPAVNPTMRGLIDVSNRLIATDEAEE